MTEDELILNYSSPSANTGPTVQAQKWDPLLAQWQKAYPYIANKSTGIKLGDYEDARRKFQDAWTKANPWTGPNMGMSFSPMLWEQGWTPTQDDYTNQRNYADYENKLEEAWTSMLTPQQLAEFRNQKHEKYKSDQMKMRAAMAAAAGGMALAGGGLGALGAQGAGSGAGAGAAAAEAGGGGMLGGGLSGSAAGLTDALGIGSGLGMEGFGSGLGLTAGGGLGGGLSGAAAGLSGGGALSGLGDIFGGLGNFGGAGGGSILDTIKDVVGDRLGSGSAPPPVGGGSPPPQSGGSGGGMDWSRLLQGMGLGSAGLAAIQALRNNMPMPAVPDYLKLAQQTADSANQAVERQTLANRPNQTNAFGDTSTWNKDPSGQWNQTVNLSDANQKRMQEQQAMMAALRGQISNQMQNPPQMPAMQGMPTNLPNVRLGALNKNLPAMGVLGGM